MRGGLRDRRLNAKVTCARRRRPGPFGPRCEERSPWRHAASSSAFALQGPQRCPPSPPLNCRWPRTRAERARPTPRPPTPWRIRAWTLLTHWHVAGCRTSRASGPGTSGLCQEARVSRSRSVGPPIRRGQLPFGVLRNALCPKAYPGSIRHGDENGSPLPYRRSSGHVGQSVVEDVPRRSEVVDPAKEIGFLQPSGPGNPCQRCPIQNMLGVWPARDLGALI